MNSCWISGSEPAKTRTLRQVFVFDNDPFRLWQSVMALGACGRSLTIKQTWNLSKILHRQIFRLNILHCQFHLISTVLVIKTQKMSENGEIYTAGKNFTLPPALTALTNSNSVCELQFYLKFVGVFSAINSF